MKLLNNKGCSMSDIVERKKKSVIWSFLLFIRKTNQKQHLTCNEKVLQGGSNSKNFNTTNLCKHLQSNSVKYKKFCKKEATKQEETQAVNAQASTQASLKQITLQG